jgi:hypothetical protein
MKSNKIDADKKKPRVLISSLRIFTTCITSLKLYVHDNSGYLYFFLDDENFDI